MPPPLWEGHEFSDDDLAFWAREVTDAALEVPEDERGSLLDVLCAGSDRLRRHAQTLLLNTWSEPFAPAFAPTYPAGTAIRDCIILRPLGRGGVGEVYKAIQRPLRRLVAIKVVTGASGGPPLLAREAINAARLLHPNIVSVYDAGLDESTPSVVMEYVDGINLRQHLEHLAREGRRPDSAVVRTIVRQTAMALGEAHRRGLVHRDVKPENILVMKRGDEFVIKVVDFGIAQRLDTAAGAAVGTPGYIAPEVLNRAPSDARADLFALGVVLFELLAGRHPFAGRSDAETCFNTVASDPPFPDNPEQTDLVAVARRALQKDPAQRYPSIEAFLADLDAPANESPGIVLNPLLSELPSSLQQWWARRSSGFFVALMSLAWGCVSLVLSVLTGAACVRVLWAAADRPGAVEMIYGYAVEPNAGLWYVAGASVCFLSGFAFLDAAHRGLARTRTLSVDDGDANPLARIAALNRAIFRYLTPLVVVGAIAFVVGPEVLHRRAHAFGWVQADLAAESLSHTYESLLDAGRIGVVPAIASLCADCAVRVERVLNRSTSFEQPGTAGFALFLTVALAHQVVLTAFLLWLAAKILFFFGLMSTALVGGARHRLRLTPDFQDRDDHRFGLGRFDNAYYAVLALVLVGSFGLFLQAAANVSKGTYFFAGDPEPALFGQAVLLLGTIALLAVLLFTPICVLLVLTIKAVDEELGRLSMARKTLEARMATAASVAERERLRHEIEQLTERRALARKQSLLPVRRPAFLGLLAASLSMLLILPVAIQWLSTPTRSGDRWLTEAVCAACGNAAVRDR